MAFLALIVFVVVLLIWFGPKTRPRVTIISNPVLGVFNLLGSTAEANVKDDLEEVAQYFNEVRHEDNVPPLCDVLLLYCEINSSGAINGSSQSLREVIRDAGAAVVVVATNNEAKNYQACLERAPFGRANLVMTIDRCESLFAGFLGKLFAQMERGVPMPIAWNNLAPQYPGADHNELPATICALERGQIAFG